MTLLIAVLLLGTIGCCVWWAFAGGDAKSARVAAVRKPADKAARAIAPTSSDRRKTVQNVLKDLEKKSAGKKEQMTIRRRLDRAGFADTPTRTFWIASAICAGVAFLACMFKGQSSMVTASVTFACGFGLPRWILGFMQRRREKKFSNDFANAIDVIIRSVRSGFPVNEAMKLVAYEFREPVSGEFQRLIEGQKLGLTMEMCLQRMFDAMPTQEVAFFGIVMSVQQQSGGNLAEALTNLSSVLRDRKRLEGKIKAMSSEAKASAMIIGALPPVVMGLVYLTTPAYIMLLFTERTGNMLLLICVFWMSLGIFVMRKMVNFKH
jgi:tight adherence protein B